MTKLHVVDSGAFSLFNTVLKKHKGQIGSKLDYSLYKTKEFWTYCDDYAAFIKKYQNAISYYVTVDACRSPELSWKITKYLENEHGLKPIPVVHFGTPIKWITKYLEEGYDYIGVGGRIKRLPYTPWADKVWGEICRTPGYLPKVKVHGFAITTHKLMVRYPYYTVDSVTWKKMSYYGQVLVPPKGHGEFRFDIPNLVVFIDEVSPYSKRDGSGEGKHFFNMSRPEQQAIREWLEEIDVPFGKRKGDKIIELGVSNDHQMRVEATIKYFEALQRSMPKWPWPFRLSSRPTLMETL